MTDPAVHELPYWEAEPDAFDAVFLGGDRLPGIAKFKPIKRGKKVDDKSAKGKNKGPLTVQGYKRAEIEFTLEILGDDEWTALQEWMPDLEPVADKKTATADDAWDISSAYTAIRGIEAIVITDLEGPENQEGIMVLTIKALEFDKPKPVATGGPGKGPLSVDIGTFANPDGTVIGDSRVARRLALAIELVTDANGEQTEGQPLKAPDGKDVCDSELLAVTADTSKGAGSNKETPKAAVPAPTKTDNKP